METRQQRLIRRALEQGKAQGDDAAEPEASLQDKALQHTDDGYVPKTLTPFEWEEFYRERGVPRSHRRATGREPGAEGERKPSFWRRFLSRWR